MIKLFKGKEGWVAEFDDPEVARLFGTPVLPTAFGEDTPTGEVLLAIQKLNPGETVIILK